MTSACAVVLSNPRSGSSMTAGILHHLGLYMGAHLIGPSPDNPLGHFEDVEFVGLHRRMIGDWRAPELNASADVIGQYRALVRKRERLPRWGLKDPRMCFVFPLFAGMLSESTELRIVHVARDLDKAARSMVARYEMRPGCPGIQITLEQAGALAKRYDAALRQILDGFAGEVLMMDYDEIVNDAGRAVCQIADFVGLPFADRAVAFIKPNLRHQ